ncbi:hypothetical protein RhiirC2_791654 [Rhizophagus irregularis]|uniref:Uncharacterized protein n=1 Tax=Rhizophagus irregularis TaxID=588596 RepID=A0A2N1MIT9_9GLOM|nr:hypothetical protein RhiirC2_791654 [Rhizophagus irregularis]
MEYTTAHHDYEIKLREVLAEAQIVLAPLVRLEVMPFLTWISAWAIKVTPFLTWISAWAIKVSWGGRRLPGFGFHKGDALPGPGFQLGLLKRRPPGFEFYKGGCLLDLDFSMGYKGRHLLGSLNLKLFINIVSTNLLKIICNNIKTGFIMIYPDLLVFDRVWDRGDACLELNFGLGYKGDVLPDLDFIKVSWEGRRPPGFGFHKGDTLPRPGFRLGLLKRRPPGFGFHKDQEKHWKNYIDSSVFDIGTARIADLNIYDENFNLVDEIYIMIENWITPIKAETLAFLMVLNVSSYMLKNKLYI